MDIFLLLPTRRISRSSIAVKIGRRRLVTKESPNLGMILARAVRVCSIDINSGDINSGEPASARDCWLNAQVSTTCWPWPFMTLTCCPARTKAALPRRAGIVMTPSTVMGT